MANSGEICSFFFEPVPDPNAPPPVAAPPSPPSSESAKKRGRKKDNSSGSANRHRCKLCNKVYTQVASTGYTNLLTHLRIKHRDWENMIKSQLLATIDSSSGEAVKESPTQIPSTLSTSSATLSDDHVPKMKRLPPGRKRGLVYEHFEEMPSAPDNKYKKMRCLYCHGATPQLSGRMRFHLSTKCQQVPEEVKAKFALSGTDLPVKVESVAKTEVAATGTPFSTLETPLATVTPPSTAIRPLTVPMEASTAFKPASSLSTSWPKKLEVDTVLLFEEKLTAALITANAPWELLDNLDFRTAMELLLPASEDYPLTAARARNQVLTRLCLKYDRECTETLASSQAITLVVNTIDGRTSGTKNTTYVAVNEWHRAFVLAESSDTTIVPYVTKVLAVVSKLKASSPRANLFLCTPTSGAFANARRELLRSASAPDKPLVLMGACMTQQTLMLLHELVICSLSLEAAFENAVLTADALHAMPSLRHHVLRCIDTKHTNGTDDGNVFAHGSVTSWRSIALAVKQALCLKPFLQQALSEEEKEASSSPSSTLRRQLMDMSSSEIAWNTLRNTAQLLTPLCFLSALSEMQTTTSGQVLALWIWVFGASTRSPLFDGHTDVLTTNLMQRLECYVEEHFVACLVLDPRVHGAGLSVSGLRRARGITVRVASALVPDLNENNFIRSYNEYMKQQGDFSESSVWNAANVSSPMEFWSDYEGDALHHQLALVGKTVCSFVPHTCSFEDMWSVFARRKTTVNVAVSEEHEQCAKIRYAAALQGRATRKDMRQQFQTLLELDDDDDDASVEAMLQSNAAAAAIQRDRMETELNLSVRSVLESIQDGIDEDGAKFEAPSSVLDASCFDVSSAGLEKIQTAMKNCLNAAIRQSEVVRFVA